MSSKTEAEETEGQQTITLTAQCLCRTHTFTTTIPLTSLPLAATYCHCTSCRHLTGALYSSYIPWPESSSSSASTSSIRASTLRRYDFVKGSITTLFCGTCSTAMFAETLPPDSERDGMPRYGVQMGVLANVDVDALGSGKGKSKGEGEGKGKGKGKGFINIAHHVFVDDTLDGGAVPWLCDTNVDGSRPRVWKTNRVGEELSSSLTALARDNWPVNMITTKTADTLPTATVEKHEGGEEEKQEQKEIPIRCHCGGVNLVLRNPTRYFASKPRSELPWFVDPVSNKSLGGFDACDSCRLSSGSDMFHWTFVLLEHLSFPSSSSSSSSSNHTTFPTTTPLLARSLTHYQSIKKPSSSSPWGTLTHYTSSPNTNRYFCNVCSASVFYAADDRPEMVDLAIGLLDAESGARAESLVSWDFGGEAGWKGDVVGGWREGFVEGVEDAAERWRAERGYPRNWRRVQKEKEKEEKEKKKAGEKEKE